MGLLSRVKLFSGKIANTLDKHKDNIFVAPAAVAAMVVMEAPVAHFQGILNAGDTQTVMLSATASGVALLGGRTIAEVLSKPLQALNEWSKKLTPKDILERVGEVERAEGKLAAQKYLMTHLVTMDEKDIDTLYSAAADQKTVPINGFNMDRARSIAKGAEIANNFDEYERGNCPSPA